MTAEDEAIRLLPTIRKLKTADGFEYSVLATAYDCRPAVTALQARDERIAALEAGLIDAAENLEGIAELTWDKRDPCRHVCDEASLMANETADRARSALKQETVK